MSSSTDDTRSLSPLERKQLAVLSRRYIDTYGPGMAATTLGEIAGESDDLNDTDRLAQLQVLSHEFIERNGPAFRVCTLGQLATESLSNCGGQQ